MNVCHGNNYEISSAKNPLQNELSNVTEELAKIYHHICTANNITPSRVMLEHSKGEIIVMMMRLVVVSFDISLSGSALCRSREIDIQVIHNLYHTSQHRQFEMMKP